MSTDILQTPLEILEPPERLIRSDDYGDRYYYKKNGDHLEWFISNTTWQKKVIPPDPGLIRWWKDNPRESIEQILDDSSEYGTFMHETFDWLLKGNEWDSSDKSWKKEYIKIHCGKEKIEFSQQRFEEWEYKIEKAIRSLIRFFHKRNVKPIASELMLANTVQGFKYGGALDLPCEMDWNGSRVMALIDYKSGNIWDNHVYQLLGYQLLWNKQYPNRKITHIFNWRPKDWNKKPTWELKNWTKDEQAKQEFQHYLNLAKMQCEPCPRSDFEYSGKLTIDCDIDDTYKEVTATERELKKFE